MPQDGPKRLTTLKKRREFLRIRGGLRYASRAFVLEGKKREKARSSEPATASLEHTLPRDTREPGYELARFGFTITKKIGGAVQRNRIRRRLKAALTELSAEAAADFDYVVIARKDAIDLPFAELKAELTAAIHHIAKAANKPRRPRKQKPQQT